MLTTEIPSATGFRTLSAKDLVALAPRPRIIDVREPAEFTGALGRIPGAELVPLATLESAARTWDKDEELVVVCRSGARSARAASLLASLGFRRLRDLAGGTQGYVDAGLPVEHG